VASFALILSIIGQGHAPSAVAGRGSSGANSHSSPSDRRGMSTYRDRARDRRQALMQPVASDVIVGGGHDLGASGIAANGVSDNNQLFGPNGASGG